VTGDSLIGIMFNALYSERLIPSLPRLLYDARAGNYDTIAQIHFTLTLSHLTSPGMYYSVQCHEEVPFNSADDVIAGVDTHPAMRDFFNSSYYMGKAIVSVCNFWGAGNGDPVENIPVESDIPTLVLAGEFDPITPPDWGRSASEYLSNSYFFEFPNLGHGVSLSGSCTLGVMHDFLSDPANQPDASCATSIDMEYVVIGAPVEMATFEDGSREMQGVVPKNWIEYEEGIYALSPMPGDARLVVDHLFGSDLERYLDYHPLSSEFQPDTDNSLYTELTYNNLTWEIFRFDNGMEFYNVGIAYQKDGSAFLVELLTPASERDWLYAQVFLPIVENLVPLKRS
jgi:hypothetical protein